jgi:DNA-binding MarR family transcriptional regulator
LSSDIEEAVEALGPVVQRYQAAVDDFDREVARVLGVNSTDLRCLEGLVGAGDAGMTPREIADGLALTTGSVTTMLDRLERAGLVARAPHPIDGRRLLVRLTPAAQERIWATIGPHLAASRSAVASDFGVDELATVRRFLTAVTAIQEEYTARLRAAKGAGVEP